MKNRMMNKLKTFWIWYKDQGQITLNQWRFHKFQPVMLIYFTYGGSVLTFLTTWPVFGLRQALFLSGCILVFATSVLAFFVMLAFIVAPFERMYANWQRKKSEEPKNFSRRR